MAEKTKRSRNVINCNQGKAERKQAEEAQMKHPEELMREHQRLFAVLENLPAMICLLTPDYHIVYANQAFKKKFGEANGRHCYEYCFGFRNGPCPFCESYRVLETGQPHNWECVSADGKTFIEAYDYPFTDIDGSFLILEMDIDITERKQAAESLQEQKLRMQIALDSAGIGIYEWNILTNELTWDERVYDFLGLPPGTPMTKDTFIRAIHPEDIAATKVAMEKAINPDGGEQSYAEFRIINPSNGIERWLAATGCITYDNRLPVKVIGATWDITERKKAEEEIRRNEARLDSLIRVSLHSELDVQRLLDYALEEAILLTESKIGYIYHYDEELQEFVLNSWSRETARECTIREPQTTYQLEKTGIWGEAVRQRKPIMLNDFQSPHPLKKGYPAGHAEIYKFLTVPIFNRGKLVAVVGVANKPTDYNQADVRQLSLLVDSIWKIVEQKRAQEVLTLSEKRYRSFIEVSNELGWVTNADGEVEEDIPSFRRYTGQSYEDIKGRGWSKALHPDDVERTMATWTKAVKEKGRYETEYRLRKYDGSYRYFLARGVPVLKEDGRVKEWVGICIDLTEWKEAEEALARYKDELEVKVKKRTEQLEESYNDLMQSQRDLKKANEQLKQYANRITQVQEEERKRIAYELHDDTAQYLSILKMQLGALAESEEIQNFKAKEKLWFLEKDADRAFNDVRRYSHELRPVVLENQGLVAALEQIADDFNKVGLLPVDVHVEGMEPDLSEEVKLGYFRVAQEALNNSRKHAKASKVDIDLRFNHKQIRMTVSDNGEGFDTKRAFNGSEGKGGLGLMSMRERSNIINADLKLESVIGKGTKVILKAKV